jgi:hypothetical protein
LRLALNSGDSKAVSTTLLSLNNTTTKPARAMATPANWILFNLSLRNNLAKNNIAIISIGPARRLSFEAPILLTASYQVKIPIERKIDAGMNSFQEWKIECGFFVILVDINNNNVPEIAILKAEIDNGDIPNSLVRYSIIIDSIEKISANKKTIHDFLIN